MGRPKGSKNKATLEKEKNILIQNNMDNMPNDNEKEISLETNKIEEETIPAPIENVRKGKQKIYEHCERCGCEIYCEPNKIDTTYLTGKAEYWRSIPRRIKICNKCSEELSNLVEKFFLEKGIMKSRYKI